MGTTGIAERASGEELMKLTPAWYGLSTVCFLAGVHSLFVGHYPFVLIWAGLMCIGILGAKLEGVR
jgi:hypothetical protein